MVPHFISDTQGVVFGSWTALKGVGCLILESLLGTINETVSSWKKHGPALHIPNLAVTACVLKSIGLSHRIESCFLYEITYVITARGWGMLENIGYNALDIQIMLGF